MGCGVAKWRVARVKNCVGVYRQLQIISRDLSRPRSRPYSNIGPFVYSSTEGLLCIYPRIQPHQLTFMYLQDGVETSTKHVRLREALFFRSCGRF